MTYEEAKVLADAILSAKAQRENIMEIVEREGLVKEYEWCEREANRCDFLNSSEKVTYRNALFSAVRWGKK